MTSQHILTDIPVVVLFQGPIVGFTFGAIIKNQNLWRISIRNELIGLSICVLFGKSLLLSCNFCSNKIIANDRHGDTW